MFDKCRKSCDIRAGPSREPTRGPRTGREGGGPPPERGESESGELTSAEREELKRLRKEVREQQQTIEILKKATAFFVKENDR
jgi:transposase-like protein